jgi:hypothetical protein
MPFTPTPRPPPSPDLTTTKVPPSRSSSSTTYPCDPDPPFTVVESAQTRRNKGKSPAPTSTQFGPPATPLPTPTSPHAATSPDVADAGKKSSGHTPTKSHTKRGTDNGAAVTEPPTPTSDDESDQLPRPSSSSPSSSSPLSTPPAAPAWSRPPASSNAAQHHPTPSSLRASAPALQGASAEMDVSAQNADGECPHRVLHMTRSVRTNRCQIRHRGSPRLSVHGSSMCGTAERRQAGRPLSMCRRRTGGCLFHPPITIHYYGPPVFGLISHFKHSPSLA